MSEYEVFKIPGKSKNGDYIEVRRVISDRALGLPDNIFIREAEEDFTQLAIRKRMARKREKRFMQYEVRKYKDGKLIAKGLFKNSPRPENEVIAYEMCKIYGIPCCKADLAKFGDTLGCISWYDLRIEEKDGFRDGMSLTNEYVPYKEKTTGEKETRDEKDLSFILDIVEYSIKDFYSKTDISPEDLETKIKENRARVIEMAMFDIIHGNGDRHNQNWGMKVLGNNERH